ncbi:hypothetical protein COO91_06472 [Nostoc flagelliforme CCNUN1]|uniref:Uncharacterized protein n=1 Tax=Nostoc flagelliforme CCNUN1 TaxID=2038116 RepID=A0A2K8SYD3_9NOSO|nr:hypothetical protein COO91_06472 [Nostoc flagelliforme CCNUN1]
MNQVSILILTLAAIIIGIIALCKEQTQHPFYLKIEVQYGK